MRIWGRLTSLNVRKAVWAAQETGAAFVPWFRTPPDQRDAAVIAQSTAGLRCPSRVPTTRSWSAGSPAS